MALDNKHKSWLRSAINTENGSEHIQLSGKCTLQFQTCKDGTVKHQIPKESPKGENNAEYLIDRVLHFMVMRHGKAKAREIFNKKLEYYGRQYEEKGLQD